MYQSSNSSSRLDAPRVRFGTVRANFRSPQSRTRRTRPKPRDHSREPTEPTVIPIPVQRSYLPTIRLRILSTFESKIRSSKRTKRNRRPSRFFTSSELPRKRFKVSMLDPRYLDTSIPRYLESRAVAERIKISGRKRLQGGSGVATRTSVPRPEPSQLLSIYGPTDRVPP